MKKKINLVIGILVIVCFSFYWIISIILVLPSTRAKTSILNMNAIFRSILVSEWKLFTPPFTHDQRLYYILRDIHQPNVTDTIEAIENISLQKQKNTPFNQKELILDYLVNKNVVRLNRILWTGKATPALSKSGAPDSSEIARAIDSVKDEIGYQLCSNSIYNYGKEILKDLHIDTAGKEMSIVIKLKIMRPFKERYNNNYVRQEIIFYETPFKPINR